VTILVENPKKGFGIRRRCSSNGFGNVLFLSKVHSWWLYHVGGHY